MCAWKDRPTSWAALCAELDEWDRRCLKANFWARDDDAIAVTPQLDRLISLANGARIEIALAVIPARLTNPLTTYLLSGEAPFFPMCHGWRHVNYSSPQRPSEFGADRPLALLVDDAACAYRAFAQQFGAVPAVFVPPFARISPTLIDELPKLGFRGISTGPAVSERRYARVASRFSSPIPRWSAVGARAAHYDVHIDPFDWSRGSARSGESIERELIGYLRVRRAAFVPVGRPIGLLLHHLAFDDRTWSVCHKLLGTLATHPAVVWPSVRAILEEAYSSPPPKAARRTV